MTAAYDQFCVLMEVSSSIAAACTNSDVHVCTFKEELAKFESKHGLTSQEVMDKCLEVKAGGGSESEFVDALVASVEYEAFVDLMRGMVEDQEDDQDDGNGFRRAQAGEDEWAGATEL